MDRWMMDRWGTDGRMDECVEGRVDMWMEERMDG